MKLLTLFCILLQILDGLFTWYGVTHLSVGLEAEGNIIVKEAMRAIGVIPALVLIKGFAVLILLKLYQHSSKAFLSIICGLYGAVALLWIVALFRFA